MSLETYAAIRLRNPDIVANGTLRLSVITLLTLRLTTDSSRFKAGRGPVGSAAP